MRSHRQFCRGAAAHTDALKATEFDRIPLFAPLSTGQGLAVLACTLLNGATLCPYPLKAKGFAGLAKWIIDRELTVWFSTASMFRTLFKTNDSLQLSSNLHTVLLATESITADDFRAFRKHFPPSTVFVHTLASSEAVLIAFHRWTWSDNIPEGVLPVGHFARDIHVSLVGDNGEPVAHGEIGEIVMKSRYLANGYWRDTELTAQRFSANLDSSGTRLFWTGDLGRIDQHGMLEVCGRKDNRIKIRGNRIEVVEIERCLEKLSGIDRAAVLAIPGESHEAILIAFVKTGDRSWTAARLRQALRPKLPLHMMPSRVVFLGDLPYRGNKIDREALRQYPLPIEDSAKGEKPRTTTEIAVGDIWADIFALPEIGLDADFFNLGGDSLQAAILTMQIEAALGVELSLGTIADHPTISTLAAFIDQCPTTSVVSLPPIVRVPRAASMPLSIFQESLWVVSHGPEGTIVTASHIIGPLNLEIFQECLRYLIERHELLRTTFDHVDGQPVQIIHAAAPLGFSFIDLAAADDADKRATVMLHEAASQTTDLTKLPILRYLLIRLAPDVYRLAQIKHRLICDGFTGRILDEEFATLYEAKLQGDKPPLPSPAALQYADFAVWQQQLMRIDCAYFKEALNWWQTLFSNRLKTLRLPFRYLILRTNRDSNQGILPWTVDGQTTNRLDEIARRVGTTPFIVRLAAFAALMADATANSTVVIGSLFQNRNRREAQGIVGPLVNTVPLVFSYDPSSTFMRWLQIVHKRVFETMAHSELPFEIVRRQLRTVGVKPPDFWVYCMSSRDHSDQTVGGALMSNEASIFGGMPGGCHFYNDQKKPENCRVYFDARRYAKKEMRVLLDRYLRLLEVAAHEPEKTIGGLQKMVGPKPLRCACTNYGWAVYEFFKSHACWKVIRRFV